METRLLSFVLAGALATVAVAAGGFHYSMSDRSEVVADTVVVRAGHADLLHKLDQMTVMEFIRIKNSRRELDYLISESSHRISPNAVQRDVYLAGEHVLQLVATVRPAEGDRSAVDVSARLPDSSFSTSEFLLAGDTEITATIIEEVAAHYLSSRLADETPYAPIDGAAARARWGLSDQQAEALWTRLMHALSEPYANEIAAAAEQANRDEEAENSKHGGARAGWRAEAASEEALRQAMEGAPGAGDWAE